MAFRGDWTPGVVYNPGDTVLYGGNVFQTGVTTVAGAPPPTQDSGTWFLYYGREQDSDLQALINTLFPGYVAGRNYTLGDGQVTTTAPAAIDQIYFYQFRLYQPINFVSAAVRVSAGGAGSSVKAGIWANSPQSGRPVGPPLAADNTGAATTGTGQITLAMSGFLRPGLYWAGTKYTGTLPTMFSINNGLDCAPNGNNISATAVSFADTYSNSMPTLAEGATFVMATGPAIIQLNT